MARYRFLPGTGHTACTVCSARATNKGNNNVGFERDENDRRNVIILGACLGNDATWASPGAGFEAKHQGVQKPFSETRLFSDVQPRRQCSLVIASVLRLHDVGTVGTASRYRNYCRRIATHGSSSVRILGSPRDGRARRSIPTEQVYDVQCPGLQSCRIRGPKVCR